MNFEPPKGQYQRTDAPFPAASCRLLWEASRLCFGMCVELCVTASVRPARACEWIGTRGKQVAQVIGDMASVVLREIAWWVIPANLTFAIKGAAFLVAPLTLAALHAAGSELTPSVLVPTLMAYAAGIYSLVRTVRRFRRFHFLTVRRLRETLRAPVTAAEFGTGGESVTLGDLVGSAEWQRLGGRIQEAAENGSPREFSSAMEDFARFVWINGPAPSADHPKL